MTKQTVPTTKIHDWENVKVPSYVRKVWEELASRDFDAYIVGGAVRDLLIGEMPTDWDIATNATPLRIQRVFGEHNVIFEKSNDQGVTFIKSDNRVVEVSTFREDITKGRKPTVRFVQDFIQDAKRRDFTINALYLDLRGVVHDPNGIGINHVKKRTLDFVGDAEQRIKEDPLRVMRGIRFLAKGFNANAKTRKALMKNAKHLSMLKRRVSIERIRDELLKMMKGDIKEAIEKMVDSGLMEEYLPEWSPMIDYDQKTHYHRWTLDKHSIETAMRMQQLTLDNTGKIDTELVFIALLHDIGKSSCQTIKSDGQATYIGHEKEGAKMIEEIFKRLKFSNQSIRRAKTLIQNHMILHQPHVLKVLFRLGDRLDSVGVDDSDLVWLYKADLWGTRREETYLPDNYRFPRVEVRAISSYAIMDMLASELGASYDKSLIGKVQQRVREFYYEYPNIPDFKLTQKVRDYCRSLKNNE